VGVGGYVLGGGNLFHEARYGWACDTVQNFEVVLTNGSIVNANATSNPDLWTALKGSSGNLGLVTRFDMSPIPYAQAHVPLIYGGVVAYNLSAQYDVIMALIDFPEKQKSDLNASVIVWWAYEPAAGGLRLAAAPVNVGNVNGTTLDGFLSIDGIVFKSMRSATMSNITAQLNGWPGLRYVPCLLFYPFGNTV
jgi:FAD/FMN-containing dehydrogenase